MSESMIQALNLMLVGMGTVFVFLVLLVVATSWMSRLAQRFAGFEEPAVTRGGPSEEELVAISAAIAQFRSR